MSAFPEPAVADRAGMVAGAAAWPRVLGTDAQVPCVDGTTRRYVDLDHAASTPVMADVWDAVADFAPWSSSVHRGSGAKSQVATEAFEAARVDIAEFVGAPDAAAVVLVRNTTEAINVLAAALPAGTRVLSTRVEHHANMLPWRRHDDTLVPFTRTAEALLGECEATLRTARPRIGLVAVTGASNVTGEVWPLRALAAIAHRHGAELFVDAAQLAPHRPIDMARDGIDLLAFSGHKLYAPFGAGALVGAGRSLGPGAPLLRGGGAVELVTPDDVVWAPAPERHEAGSPNVMGAVALAAACRALRAVGMDAVAEHERRLAARLEAGLARVPGLERLALWPAHADRVGVATFTLAGHRHPLVAAVLAAEHAIGVRHGCFCAHPLLARLLHVTDLELGELRAALAAGRRPPMPGAVRASLGLDSTTEDVDRLVVGLSQLARSGPRTRYDYDADHDDFRPAADPRPRPARSSPRASSMI